MDDSVLPARFDPIKLPGLPPSVGYIDIGDRTPQELARLVLNKLDDEYAAVGTYLGPSGVVLTIFLGALLGSVIFGPVS